MDPGDSTERFLAAMSRVEEAVSDLRTALDQVGPILAQTSMDLRAGRVPADLILDNIRSGRAGIRRELHTLTRRFERVVRELRGEVIRILVHDGHMSMTQVARELGLSAQMAKRLYRVAEPNRQ